MKLHRWSWLGVLFVLFVFVTVGCSKAEQPGPNPKPNPDGGQQESVVPVITIESPVRGAMLTDGASVKIVGSMNVPADRIVKFQINGKDVSLEKDGSFSAKMSAEWGLNMIAISATDKDGIPAERSQGFFWAKQYQSMNGERRDKAAMARLNQPAIDDDNRGTLNDLASILEHVLGTLDVDSLVPELLAEGVYRVPPIGPKVKYTVKKTGPLIVGRRKVSLQSRKDGLEITIQFRDLSMPVHGKAGKLLNKKADVKAEYIEAKVSADIRVANDLVVVSIEKIEMDLTQLEVKAFSGVFGFLNKTVTKRVRESIEKQMNTMMRGLVPPLVKGFLQNFKFARDFTLPEVLGSKVLSLDSGLDYLVFDDGGGTIGLAAAVSGELGVADGKLGTPLRGQLAPEWGSGYAFGIGLSYNLMNQVLTAAWRTGALKQDVSDLIKNAELKLPLEMNNLQVQVDALLPPLLHPLSDASAVDVGVGDLALDLSFEQANGEKVIGRVFLNILMGANLTITSENELDIKLAADPKKLLVDIVKLEGLGASASNQFNELIRSMAPVIANFVSASVIRKIPIPSFDLGALAGQFGIPKGTTLTLQNGKSSLKGDYVKVTGDL